LELDPDLNDAPPLRQIHREDNMDTVKKSAALRLIETGNSAALNGDFVRAEAAYRAGLEIYPHLPMAFNNLGRLADLRGESKYAEDYLRSALRLHPDFRLANDNLAELLFRQGRIAESMPYWERALCGANDEARVDRLVGRALNAGQPAIAARFAIIHADIKHGIGSNNDKRPLLSKGKLTHDIEQFGYLRERGRLGRESWQWIAAYSRVLDRLQRAGLEGQTPMLDEDSAQIGGLFGKLIYVSTAADTLPNSCFGDWSPDAVDRAYRDHAFGLVVVDDFLSPEALTKLREFCLDSTVWSSNRYAYNRLGAFFRDGFNNAVLVSIGTQLAERLPNVIGDRHKLLQIWGFKYAARQPRLAAHADFAAVNVNLWITPDGANRDPTTGGMDIYDVSAPADWTFDRFNRDGKTIQAFLTSRNAEITRVPYRENRAVLFNSDMFHATSAVDFDEHFENRRINVTFLYGRRSGII